MATSNYSYYYSETLNSFPTTKMESVNKLITENSLTRLINRLLDVDGFIITDGITEKGSGPVIGNGGVHLPINSNLRLDGPNKQIDLKDDLLEFVIRGYYFSIDINELLSILNTYDNITSTTSDTGVYARIFIDNINPNYPELIGQTSYEEGVPLNRCVQFFACDIGNKPTPYHEALESMMNGNGEIEGLGTDYLYFDLLLIRHIKNDNTVSPGIYLPYNSMNRFDNHAVRIIDGGEFSIVSN